MAKKLNKSRDWKNLTYKYWGYKHARVAKSHNVCFECHISFKDIMICPHCRRPLVNAGRRFKPPSRNNVRDWKRLALIHLAGHTYRCWNVALTPREARKQLEEAWTNNPIDAFGANLIPSRKPAPYEKSSRKPKG